MRGMLLLPSHPLNAVKGESLGAWDGTSADARMRLSGAAAAPAHKGSAGGLDNDADARGLPAGSPFPPHG